jgi:hypothetical protein
MKGVRKGTERRGKSLGVEGSDAEGGPVAPADQTFSFWSRNAQATGRLGEASRISRALSKRVASGSPEKRKCLGAPIGLARRSSCLWPASGLTDRSTSINTRLNLLSPNHFLITDNSPLPISLPLVI